MTGVTRAEICVAACADVWRSNGEILASPMGLVPTLGARLAKLTFAPDLLLSDGEAFLLDEIPPLGKPATAIEGWLPYGRVFDVVAAGRRHVMMGASQLDRYGNQNISCIGDWAQPKSQLLGVRGAPGNTANNATSYWIPAHSRRVFVDQVDMVSGVGNDRAQHGPESARRFHDLRFVVTDKAVLDFATPDGSLRLRSVHPGLTLHEIVDNTGFPLAVPDDITETRVPDGDELQLIREVLDTKRLRDKEVRA